MCNYLDDIRLKFEELCSNREMDMPILSDEDIRRLPNIFQLIEILKKREIRPKRKRKVKDYVKGQDFYIYLLFSICIYPTIVFY